MLYLFLKLDLAEKLFFVGMAAIVIWAVAVLVREDRHAQQAARPSNRVENARRWAEGVGIKSATINCDETPMTCACTARYVDASGADHLVALGCCGHGCEIVSKP